jgi:hypothetical protein
MTMGSHVHPLSPPPHILPDPQKGALTELLQREMLPFWSPPTISTTSPSQWTPQVPQRAPTYTPVSRAFFDIFPSKSPVNEPPPHVLQQGPHGERSLISRDNGLFNQLYVRFPNKEPSHEKRGKYLVTVHGAPRGRKAYIKWGAAWFPQGDRLWHCSLYPSAMQPSTQYLPPWLG